MDRHEATKLAVQALRGDVAPMLRNVARRVRDAGADLGDDYAAALADALDLAHDEVEAERVARAASTAADEVPGLVLRRLAAGRARIREIATAIGRDTEVTRRALDALVHSGLVTAGKSARLNGASFALTSDGRAAIGAR